MLQTARDAMAPGLVADVPVLPPHQFFDDRNGIIWCNDAAGVITAKLAVRWAARPNMKLAQSGSRLCVVRRFAAYMSAHDARTEVPAQKLLPYHLCRRDPYHYTDEDVQRLINASRQIDPSGQIKGPTMATLFGLLAVTGMRVGEALDLMIAHAK